MPNELILKSHHWKPQISGIHRACLLSEKSVCTVTKELNLWSEATPHRFSVAHSHARTRTRVRVRTRRLDNAMRAHCGSATPYSVPKPPVRLLLNTATKSRVWLQLAFTSLLQLLSKKRKNSTCNSSWLDSEAEKSAATPGTYVQFNLVRKLPRPLFYRTIWTTCS